jgi:hypothetical protein
MTIRTKGYARLWLQELNALLWLHGLNAMPWLQGLNAMLWLLGLNAMLWLLGLNAMLWLGLPYTVWLYSTYMHLYMHIIRHIFFSFLLIHGYLIDTYINLRHLLCFLPIPGRPNKRVINGICHLYMPFILKIYAWRQPYLQCICIQPVHLAYLAYHSKIF